MEYTFSSTDAGSYNEIICPLNYTGASVQVKWYVSYINGKANTVLLDTDDYCDINDERYYVTDTYTSLDNLTTVLDGFFQQAQLNVAQDNAGRVKIYGSYFFWITGMSKRMMYATGFHYLKRIDLEAMIDAEEKYFVKAKATPFDYLTPLWYVVSNLGSPNQVASMTEKYKIYYPAVAVKIVNTFTDGQALNISNGDYQTVSRASSLSNLKLTVVDGNLEPIKFLTPIYVTVCVEPVPLDESVEEALQEQAPNKSYVEQLRQQIEKNNQQMEALINKMEMGVSVEPQHQPFEETTEKNQPPPLPTEVPLQPPVITPDDTPGTQQETPQIIQPVDIDKDDDRTEEKEQGQVEQQEQAGNKEE